MDQNGQDLKSKLDTLLTQSGDIDQLKELLRTRLVESGWREEIRLACNKLIKENGLENTSVDSLVSDITPIGREKIPVAVKKELLQRINTAVQKHIDK